MAVAFAATQMTALVINEADACGAVQGALYDSVAADDLFEWREAADSWVRYQLTEV